jgi:hypothetical protein
MRSGCDCVIILARRAGAGQQFMTWIFRHSNCKDVKQPPLKYMQQSHWLARSPRVRVDLGEGHLVVGHRLHS